MAKNKPLLQSNNEKIESLTNTIENLPQPMPSDLGNATPDKVLKGNTFSSNEGILLTGNMVLPIGLHIAAPPAKTSYLYGESLDLTGFKVVLKVWDGTQNIEQDVTSDCVITPANGTVLNLSNTQVKATYTHQGLTYTAIQEISVKNALASIAVTTQPSKTQYKIDETLDLSGIAVTATYLNGATKDVTSSCSFNPTNGSALTTVGTNTITVSYTEDGTSKSTTCNVTVNPKVYGIMRDINSSSPQWTRTGDAVGKTAVATKGTAAGHSDFDSIYPWSEIKRERLNEGAGDEGTFVTIPKFYYRRFREGSIERTEITGQQMDGFELHPAFKRPDKEYSSVTIGAYPFSYMGLSEPGPQPSGAYNTLSQARNRSKTYGQKYGVMDMSTLSAIQMLILVEFATNDVQSAIGMGNCKNTVILENGMTDDMFNEGHHTGTPTGTAMKTSVLYRGIENLWGNIHEYLDGVIRDHPYLLYSNDFMNYNDEGAGYTTVYNIYMKTGYVSKMAIRPDIPHLFAHNYDVEGSSSTYYCDATEDEAGIHAKYVFFGGHYKGGCFEDGYSCGIFAYLILEKPSDVNYNRDENGNYDFGFRVMYLNE